MTWQTRVIEVVPQALDYPCRCTTPCGAPHTVHVYVDKATGNVPVVGDVFYHPMILERRRSTLSVEYFRDHAAQRPPICVILPNAEWLVVDGHYVSKDGPPTNHGWTVVGPIDCLSVHPSINCVGRYHGWLKAGVLSADVDGLVFV